MQILENIHSPPPKRKGGGRDRHYPPLPTKSQNNDFVVNSSCFKHTKFQKISLNGLDFLNFLHFCRRFGPVINFYLLRGIDIPNLRGFHQKFPKIICDKRTHKCTDKGESIGPFGLQPGTY